MLLPDSHSLTVVQRLAN